MLTIKETSWHYRLIRFADMYVPSNLCPYVRRVIKAAFFLLFVGCVITGVSILASLPILQWIPFWIFVHINSYFAAFVGLVEAGLLTWLLIMMVRDRWEDEFKANPAKQEIVRLKALAKANKPPSIFKEYLRATHDKICPGLKFEE